MNAATEVYYTLWIYLSRVYINSIKVDEYPLQNIEIFTEKVGKQLCEDGKLLNSYKYSGTTLIEIISSLFNMHRLFLSEK